MQRQRVTLKQAEVLKMLAEGYVLVRDGVSNMWRVEKLYAQRDWDTPHYRVRSDTADALYKKKLIQKLRIRHPTMSFQDIYGLTPPPEA